MNSYYYQFNDCKIKLNYILFIILYKVLFFLFSEKYENK